MNKQQYNKRSMVVDIILITAIFSILLSIIFITLIDQKIISEQTGSVTYSAPVSKITETTSTFPTIKIMSDVSTDSTIPYDIQYPITKHDEINSIVNTFIEDHKSTYINKILLKKVELEIADQGLLTISLHTYPYDERYYSFLFENSQKLPKEAQLESTFTLLMDDATGEIISISSLLNQNLESLQILSTQIQTAISQDPRFGHLPKELIEAATVANWDNYRNFILSEDQIIFYFNTLLETNAHSPLTMAIPLSTINPLLNEDFQVQMVEEVEEVEEEVVSKPDQQKRVALTFDDGPHPNVTPQILALLKKYNAKATFFMLGSRVAYYPDIAVQVYESGNEVGNHTFNHPVLTKLSKEQILSEYTMTENAIKNAIGVPSTLFRPPYGATNELVKTSISGTQITWTIDTEDWKYRSAAKLLPSIKNAMHNNAIILMHDIHQSTADGLENVLQYLQAEGYEMVTVSEILKYR